MGTNLIQFIEKMNPKDIDTQIALQCAPLLSGIKIANILITEYKNIEKIKQIFNDAPYSYKLIHQNDNRMTFLVYQKEQLKFYIMGKEQTALLYSFGYDDTNLTVILERFANRFTEYMKEKVNEKADFPHEMGILLGYPVEDVIGFIENRGQNAIYTGYWKVYSNLQQAKQTFDNFNKAKATMIQLLFYGESIENIIRIYGEYHTQKRVWQ